MGSLFIRFQSLSLSISLCLSISLPLYLSASPFIYLFLSLSLSASSYLPPLFLFLSVTPTLLSLHTVYFHLVGVVKGRRNVVGRKEKNSDGRLLFPAAPVDTLVAEAVAGARGGCSSEAQQRTRLGCEV
jgi:hypothetical protein